MMKKINSEGLRIFGIVVSVLGIGLIARPLITALLGHGLIFSFFGLFTGIPAIVVSVIVLVAGLLVLEITEPLDEENKH